MSNNRVRVNAVVLIAAQVISKSIGFVILVLLANYLGREQFGTYSFALAFATLFIPLIDLGIDTLSVREISRNLSKANKYLGNILILKIVSSVVVCVAIFGTINILNYSFETRQLVYLAGLIIILRTYSNSFIAIFRAFQRMKYEAIILVLSRILESIAIVAAIFLTYPLRDIMLLLLFSNILILLMTVILLLKQFIKPLFSVDWGLWKYLIKEGLPFAMTGIFVMIYFKIDNVLLSKMIGDSAVGLYNSSTNLIYPITVISSAIIIAIFPSISQNIGRDPDQAIHIYRASLKYSLLIALPIAIALTFLSDKIYLFLYAQDFYAANVTLKILAWLLPVIFITGIYGYTLAAVNKQTIVFLISVINAFVNLGLNLLLIPTYGYNGAAVATVITELIGFLIGSYFLTKYFSRFPFKILLKSFCLSLVILPVLLLKHHLHLVIVVILAAAVYTLFLIIFKQISIDSLKGALRSTAGDDEAGLEHTTIGRNHQT